MNQRLINVEVVFGHPVGREIQLEVFATGPTVDFADPIQRGHGFFHVMHNEACHTMQQDLGNRAARIRNHRSAACHRLDHHQSERFGPIDREQHRNRIPQKFGLLGLPNFSHEFDQRMVQKRFDLFLEIIPIRAIDLGSDLQLLAGADRNLDGMIETFLRRDPA